MLFRKTGFPEEDEMVLCTVTNVQHNSVFVRLDEYSKSGMIHISEVSPGRIRNIRDFVREGKKVICKVLRVNEERDHIDLSLRRVNEMQRREKLSWIKQEEKSEKIVEQVAKKLGLDFNDLYTNVLNKVLKKYDSLHSYFDDIIAGNVHLDILQLDEKLTKDLEESIRARIKPPQVSIKGYFKLTSYKSNGVQIIMEALTKADHPDIQIRYLGSGNYSVEITAPDYKEAEKIIGSTTKNVLDFMKKNDGEGEFVRPNK